MFLVVSKDQLQKYFFNTKRINPGNPITMLVDTGADYTLLPYFLAHPLGINLITDCKVIHTQGVGGTSKVYLFKKKIKVKLGKHKREVPVGFLSSDLIPPVEIYEKVRTESLVYRENNFIILLKILTCPKYSRFFDVN